MKKYILGLVFGIVFGLGLSLSKMTDPQVVLNFFDVLGDFNPMLLWVFITALFVTVVGYFLVFKLSRPLFEKKFYLNNNKIIDKPLISGAVLFGIGWGISGYCPAPVIGVAYSNSIEFIVFFIPMLLAIILVNLLKKPKNNI